MEKIICFLVLMPFVMYAHTKKNCRVWPQGPCHRDSDNAVYAPFCFYGIYIWLNSGVED